jgi:HK97 family phage major capsid protein
MIKVLATGFFVPDGIVMHPLDWQDVRLLRTADGLYIWGSPAEAGPERMWSLPVALTTAITQNTGAVGAFQLGAQIFYRQGITVESTNSNEDDFKKNLIALRAEQREAVAWYRPKAFCTVTGI